MIITLVIDTFNVNNNGTTVSAMRFADSLISRGHTVRVVACGDPADATGQGWERPEMFWVPELVVPIASRLAHRQDTVFAKPDREVLIAAIKGADVVHIYQPWPLGRAAERIARRSRGSSCTSNGSLPISGAFPGMRGPACGSRGSSTRTTP